MGGRRHEPTFRVVGQLADQPSQAEGCGFESRLLTNMHREGVISMFGATAFGKALSVLVAVLVTCLTVRITTQSHNGGCYIPCYDTNKDCMVRYAKPPPMVNRTVDLLRSSLPRSDLPPLELH